MTNDITRARAKCWETKELLNAAEDAFRHYVDETPMTAQEMIDITFSGQPLPKEYVQASKALSVAQDTHQSALRDLRNLEGPVFVSNVNEVLDGDNVDMVFHRFSADQSGTAP